MAERTWKARPHQGLHWKSVLNPPHQPLLASVLDSRCSLAGHFVQTNSMFGITARAVRQMIDLLMRDRSNSDGDNNQGQKQQAAPPNSAPVFRKQDAPLSRLGLQVRSRMPSLSCSLASSPMDLHVNLTTHLPFPVHAPQPGHSYL